MQAQTKMPSTIVLEGKGRLTLSPAAHVATGGEGSIYRVGDTCIKIYLDHERMKREGIDGKIRLLAALKHPFLVAPEGIVTTNAGDPIGFYMKFAEGMPLPRLFTNDTRRVIGFTDQDVHRLVEGMKNGVQFAHDHRAIMVDGNELNYLAHLVAKQPPEPRFLDVDSWTVGRWHSVAIMPSIRDYHATQFTELTDWFSWGIVTFQLYTGVHPYKGRLEGFDFSDFVSRMKAQASVFRKGVRLNQAVRDFSCIPSELRAWYEAVFEHGERSVPPSPLAPAVAPVPARVMRMRTMSGGTLVFEKLLSITNDTAVQVFPCGVALYASGKLFDLSSRSELFSGCTSETEVVRVEDGWLVLTCDKGVIKATHIEYVSYRVQSLTLPVTGERIVRFGNRVFVVTKRGLTELLVKVFGKPLLAAGQTWGVVLESTRWYDGCGIQDALGATYIVAPYGDDRCAHVRVRELDRVRPIAAKAGNRFIAIVALDKTGAYHKFEIAFDKEYLSYSLRSNPVDSPELNMAILDRGVCASIPEDGKLVIEVPSSGASQSIGDPDVTTDLTLFHQRGVVTYVYGDAVWTMRMR